MRKLALAVLLAAVNSASAQYTFVLRFPDGSAQICASTGFIMDFATITANVQDCVLDKVFSNGFGG
jgi:hypothetical protein